MLSAGMSATSGTSCCRLRLSKKRCRSRHGLVDPIRFNVAGLVAEFQGKKYLLLQRAAIVYNYGNFGR